MGPVLFKCNFSLLGLLAFVFFFELTRTVFVKSTPWRKVEILEGAAYAEGKRFSSASDGRFFDYTPYYVLICTYHGDKVQLLAEIPANVLQAWFTDSTGTECILQMDCKERTGILYRRFYPEWWWGHFCRHEVWLAIIFGSLWLWRVVLWFRVGRLAPIKGSFLDRKK